MEKKRSINLGFRGWILVIYQAAGFFAFTAFTSWPQNLLADMYGGQTTVSTIYTVGCLVGIAAQLIISKFIGRFKNVMNFSIILGAISMLLALGVMLIGAEHATLWLVVYFLVTAFITTWCTFTIGIVVGQWFPTRKGTVMGIATIAFPLTNALLSNFAAKVYTIGTFKAFLPYWIVSIVCLILGAVFIKDFPEKCGCYRDNDKSMTPEIAKAMMETDIENKKTSVWTIGKTLKCRDFWFLVLPEGFLLASSVGMMTQLVPILNEHADELASIGGYSTVMIGAAIIACIGSWLLGVIDTKIGTRKAIIIAVIFMIISGILGTFNSIFTLMAAVFALAVYEGAASNFTVSCSAQYWRREDYANVFSVVNPVVNIIQAAGPTIIAVVATFALGYRGSFLVTGIMGVVGLILILCVSPKHIKETDDKYRTAAGKPLDDALAGRK